MTLRRTPLKRGTKRIGVNKARRGKNWLRAYESEDRVEWIAAQPSVVSGRVPCVNAHVVNGGMGRKAEARWIVPLTHEEHMELHASGITTFQNKYGVNLLEMAIQTERRWRQHAERCGL